MPTDAEQLARLRVAVATGHLPADVGEWTLGRIETLERRLPRHAERDRHLRNAAAVLVPGGSRWAKARAVQEQLLRFRTMAAAGRGAEPGFGVTWHAWAALRVDPETPASIRQLLRILGD